MALIIGIAGDIGSGKDTLAVFMQEYAKQNNIPCHIRGMAHSLRSEVVDFLMKALPQDHPGRESREACFELLINRDTKEQFRGLMRWWGTEYRRMLFQDDYWIEQHRGWVKWVEHCEKTDKVIILVPDVRYLNEAEYITTSGGIVMEVFRPELMADKSHSSDTGLVDYKFHGTLLNDQGIEELRLAAWKLFVELVDWKWGNASSNTTL